jgi:hypothetical protein
VELHRSGDVPLLVEVGVLVHLGHDQAVVAELRGDPVGRDEDGVRVSVLRPCGTSPVNYRFRK